MRQTQKLLSTVRNIGIIAHVDAGKTTLTEQMLYLSKKISHSGSVDRGTTVTDFMDEERRRGITIKSSFVSLPWRGVNINLLDTPGHIDFNFEVECALSVMDGCVLIIDGCKGVESQTLQVWQQALKYNLPTLVLVNKMDRQSYNFDLSIKSIAERLCLRFAVLHRPSNDGLVDIVTSEENLHKDDLLSAIAEKDQKFCQKLLEGHKFDRNDIYSALSGLVQRGDLSVVLAGSATKGVGVPQLMDCVVDMLPSPDKTANILLNRLHKVHSRETALYVYKVSYSDQHGGFLAFVRVICGNMNGICGSQLKKMFKMDQFYCWRRLERVRISYGRLYNVFADEITPIDDQVTTFCSIVVAGGDIKAGDILSTMKKPMKDIVDYLPRLPNRPFLVNIEAADAASDRKFLKILQQIEHEDSSIMVNVDDFMNVTLETVGPLHLDVIRNHIREHYHLSSQVVKTRVSYRECLLPKSDWHCSEMWVSNKTLGGRDHSVSITLRFRSAKDGKSGLKISQHVEESENFRISHKQALEHGFSTALQAGPLMGASVEGVSAEITEFETSPGCLSSLVSNAMCQYLRSALGEVEMILHEPHQEYEILCDRNHVDAVLTDLSLRRGRNCGIVYMAERRVRINCSIPLGESVSYADQLRTITSGMVELSCCGSSYHPVEDQT